MYYPTISIFHNSSIMKKASLFFIVLMLSGGLFAQKKSADGFYTASGGILGAGDFSRFRTAGNNLSNIDYKFKPGWTAGAWLNFPLGRYFSFEPQVTYSILNYELKNAVPGALNGNIGYFSVPLLLKVHVMPKLALTAGFQIDWVNNVVDDNSVANEDMFNHNGTSLSGGVEVMPHSRLSIFGRYIHGISDMNYSINSGSTTKLYNQNIQVGLKWKLFGKFIPADKDGDGITDPQDKCPTVPGLERYQGCPIPDTDNDGINDEEDKCPTVAGLPKYQGCPIPDSDGDGINDEADKCPQQKGTAKYQGCPVPDTDGDGINDEEDKCPTQAGLAKYQGCPIPDTDGDGVNDEDDRCPNVPGTAEMKGCPTLEQFQPHEVTFASSKAVLTVDGKKELDIIYDFLTRNADVNVRIDGHTDATGNDKINDPLSLNRANAAKAYLVSKGIDAARISTEGRGSKEPVADNKTKEGKKKNRRINITVL
jgi:outer membrane protein OmpA-like peptidoglycan-associated protein